MRTRPLAEISARDLRPLLEEESEHWAQELLWDYTDVSSAVASGLERRALTGFVLQDGPRSVAYCYYMLDAGRAIVGSLFAAAGFREQVGVSPKLLGRILRFQRAVSSAGSGPGWAEIAVRCGYYDQAHMVRDFHQFAGASPGEFARRKLPDGGGVLGD